MDCFHKNPRQRFLYLFASFFSAVVSLGASADGDGLPVGTEKALKNNSAQLIEQDKIRKEHLLPLKNENNSSVSDLQKDIILFPEENNCYDIESVSYHVDNDAINFSRLRDITRQAEGKCLGIEGIRLLSKTIQNEIIRMGYITTRLEMPDQDLTQRKLNFTVLTGKVGKIRLAESSGNYISLKNTLPLHEGDILNLRDLEQGSFNLKRVPGSEVKIEILPGKYQGESDVDITREQKKYWQVAAWLDDAGSKATGRYQGGGALYLNNITSLSDSLYFSYGRDIDFSHKPFGNSNRAVGYSVPWNYWWLDFYASESQSQQHIQGNQASWNLNNYNHYLSAQVNYLLSQSMTHKTTAGMQIFNIGTRYYFNGHTELTSMHKKSAGLKAIIKHSHRWERSSVDTTLSLQKKMPWFGSLATQEAKFNLIDHDATIATLNIAGSGWFDIASHKIHYAPQLNVQLSPNRLSSLDRFSIGSRWTVRGFDGESSLQQNQGGYWRNTFSLILPEKNYQPYLGADVGRIIGDASQNGIVGKTLMGSVAGVRGWLWNTSYDVFLGVPLIKPHNFHTDSLTLGFSMQWSY
ncbi:ShlB/FhaC/HecB family hemolysin secretion/activation protein [Erwinia sp. 9145]|uniref:ShlB/FhaC/HecB family hemolysin secretion/activation protein n=1 Tax=Erwinia sp. 9145 TaxID=1500895 RepID=UPI000691A0BC|nr:ShlB/FhaC/HecB family hemolysin secretion/activation protein [Erwinia sp. 9145]